MLQQLKCEFGYPDFGARNYTLLYHTVYMYDWPEVYKTSVDMAVAGLNATLRDAIDWAIPRCYKHKFRFFP
jgi:hypothetical protein